jgi:chromosomal replication initiator protein
LQAQFNADDIFSAREQTVTIEMIQKAVADYYGMRVQDLKAKDNSHSVALLRQIAMYICNKLTRCSLPQIGRDLGINITRPSFTPSTRLKNCAKKTMP